MKFAEYKSSIVELKQGINENVSSLELQAGELLDVKNYMMAEGGYGGYLSTRGYERMDGAIIPSEHVSYTVTINEATSNVLLGETMTGDPSAASAVAIADGYLESGTYGVDAIIIVQVQVITGTFVAGDLISTSGLIGTFVITNVITGGFANYHAALDTARATVQPVPGEGNVLGLYIFEAEVYAFRKKASVPVIGLYKQDPSGWVEIDTSSDPLFYDGVHDFKFATYNFKSTADTNSFFWVDGTNQCRQFDGTDVITISNTGMFSQALDAPTHIATHNYHLFLAYRGGSLQHSKLGDPAVWDGTVGASEIGLGAEVTNLVAGVQSSLIIYLGEAVRVLSGNSIDDWVLQVFSDVSGAYNRTARRLLGSVYSVGDRGVSTLEAVDTYGDYAANSISQRFKQTLFAKKDKITTCIVNRDLNQYRIFFEDKSGIYMSFIGKELQGATFIEFPDQISCSAQGENSNQLETIVFVTNDEAGFVYIMDSGTSFDGLPIICRMSTAYYHYGSPRQRKAFKRATFEISAQNEQTFDIKVDFDYNELGSPRTIWYTPTLYNTDGGAVYSITEWGTMRYGGSAVTNRVPIYLQGIGTNMSYKILSNEMYRPQHVVQNVITDYSLVGRRI